MTATLCLVRDPFRHVGADQRPVAAGVSIASLAPVTPQPFVAMLNGAPVLRAEWGRPLADGDILSFIVLPTGGGDGKNPLHFILSLALFAVAGPAAGLLGLGRIGTSIAHVAILAGGNALINALLPPPVADPLAPAREVFHLSPQGNVARLEQPIPVQYGRLRFQPDFAAVPWEESTGDDQFLHCLYCLGAGQFDVERIEIGDVSLAAFGEVETQVVPPGGQVTLFPSAVETSPLVTGQELRGLVRPTFTHDAATGVLTITENEHRRASGQTVHVSMTGQPTLIAQIDAVPDENTWTVAAPGWTAASGTADVRTVLGGIEGTPASQSGSVATEIGIDLLWPHGLVYVGAQRNLMELTVDVTVEARRIDDAGAPLGGWVHLGTASLTAATPTPQRRSWRFALPTPGRWAVRCWRIDQRRAGHHAHDVHWAGLRGYLTEDQDWPPVTLLAMRMRATGNLARQAARRVSVIATRMLPTWTGTAWTPPAPTRSIAWALADMARNTSYGAGLPDAQIDLAGLLALHALWDERDDHADIRIVDSGGWWDAASRIALAGRARVLMQGGRLRVVRDGPETIPIAMFSQRNIVEGSFSIDWLMSGPAAADAVEVSYLDATSWQPERVLANPGTTAPQRPARIRLDAVTSRDQALREGLYHAAANRFRRRVVRFATELEGFIPSPGDLVAVQHDLVGWGASALVAGWNGDDLRLTLSEPVDWSGTGHVIGLRRRDGSVAGPVAATRGRTDHEAILAAHPGIEPDTGMERERTHAVIGRGTVLAKIVSVRPRDALLVDVEAVIEDPAVHSAETGRSAAARRLGHLPRWPDAPVIHDLRAVLVTENSTVHLSWRAAPGAYHYEIETAEGGATVAQPLVWTRVAEITVPHAVLPVPARPQVWFRVRAIGRGAGAWATVAVGPMLRRFWHPLNAPFWGPPNAPFWDRGT